MRAPSSRSLVPSPQTELIDEFAAQEHPSASAFFSHAVPEEHKSTIGIRHAAFTWAASSSSQASVTPGGTRKRTFMLRIADEVLFRRGKLNLVVGPTGAGKTSLLMALLGEMHYVRAGPDAFVSLPREGGVAYAAQESWVQNDTIRVSVWACVW